jgi:hypothetical protein
MPLEILKHSLLNTIIDDGLKGFLHDPQANPCVQGNILWARV